MESNSNKNHIKYSKIQWNTNYREQTSCQADINDNIKVNGNTIPHTCNKRHGNSFALRQYEQFHPFPEISNNAKDYVLQLWPFKNN